MKIRKIMEINSIIMTIDEFKKIQEDGNGTWKRFEQYDEKSIRKSTDYGDLVPTLKENEVVLIAKYIMDTAPHHTKEFIIQECLRGLGVTKEQVFKRTRLRKVVEKRQVIQAMLYFCTTNYMTDSLSLSEIGYITGRMHHTTVLYSVKKVLGYYQVDAYFRKCFDNLQLILKTKGHIDQLKRL